MTTIKLNISMHCGSCEGKIQKVLKGKAEEVMLNVAAQRAKITFDENKTTQEEITKLIEGLGYEVSE